MMKIFVFISAVLIFMGNSILLADEFNNLVKNGNEAFVDGDYKTALDYYHQAEVERPEMPELDYNIGSALYKEGKYEEAVDKLQSSMNTNNIQYEANAYYNQGNVYYQMGDYQNAITAYQNSLELNSEDLDAKYNLELARKMLKEQIKPDQQQQDQQQQQQPQDQKDQEQQQEQQQPQEDEQKQEDQQQQQQQQQQQMNEDEMSKEDAERILNALKDDEKENQEEQKRFQAQGDYRGNDW
ncbi:MAG: tetratricopeptide repeat protein [Candidatus Zixiibacteriota bacterium]